MIERFLNYLLSNFELVLVKILLIEKGKSPPRISEKIIIQKVFTSLRNELM